MIRRFRTSRSRKGMALLVVLFIVMAIAIISSAFIARSDTALACGRNFRVHTEADYAAWGGLEIAWALVQDPNTLSTITFPMTDQLDLSSNIYYDLTVGTPVSNVYPVTCSGYTRINGQDRARSTLYADLYRDSDTGTACFIAVRREE